LKTPRALFIQPSTNSILLGQHLIQQLPHRTPPRLDRHESASPLPTRLARQPYMVVLTSTVFLSRAPRSRGAPLPVQRV